MIVRDPGPLGFLSQIELPAPPPEDMRTDMFVSGSEARATTSGADGMPQTLSAGSPRYPSTSADFLVTGEVGAVTSTRPGRCEPRDDSGWRLLSNLVSVGTVLVLGGMVVASVSGPMVSNVSGAGVDCRDPRTGRPALMQLRHATVVRPAAGAQAVGVAGGSDATNRPAGVVGAPLSGGSQQ